MASKSFASLRLRPIQAKNRSTTQRRGFTAKPIWSGFLRTISTAINVAVVTFSSAYPLSAKTRWTNGKMRRETRRSGTPPSRSWMLAACGSSTRPRPSVSTSAWRLRPLIFFPAS